MSVDGIFGVGTRDGTRTLQRSRSLDADGIVGPACWALVPEPDTAVRAQPMAVSAAQPVALHRTFSPRNNSGARVQRGAGALIRGTAPFASPLDQGDHLSRAVWLTAQVEGAKWGTVQSYDGAGMSGGVLHNTALFPRTMKSGQLWELVAEVMAEVPDLDEAAAMGVAIGDAGWELTSSGKLLSRSGGDAVAGEEIRRTLTPPDGNVPDAGASWEEACRWASLFHGLLSAEQTRPAQVRYAAQWLCRARPAAQRPVYSHYVGQDSARGAQSSHLPPEVDLAMCVYHAFVVNAPGPAAEVLKRTLDAVASPRDFSALLPRRLGLAQRSNFRRRYRATREAALAGQVLGLWEPAVVQHVIPELPQE